jgi:hypothetical protein
MREIDSGRRHARLFVRRQRDEKAEARVRNKCTVIPRGYFPLLGRDKVASIEPAQSGET